VFTGPPLRNFLKAGERGEPGNLGTEVPPVGSRGKAPIRGADDQVTQKLKQNGKLVYILMWKI